MRRSLDLLSSNVPWHSFFQRNFSGTLPGCLDDQNSQTKSILTVDAHNHVILIYPEDNNWFSRRDQLVKTKRESSSFGIQSIQRGLPQPPSESSSLADGPGTAILHEGHVQSNRGVPGNARGQTAGRRCLVSPKGHWRVLHCPRCGMEAIKSMNKKGVAPDEIAKEVQKTAKLGTELIKYLAKAEIEAWSTTECEIQSAAYLRILRDDHFFRPCTTESSHTIAEAKLTSCCSYFFLTSWECFSLPPQITQRSSAMR